MMKRAIASAIVLGTLLTLSGPAAAWGPVTQTSIVNASAHVLSREDSYMLTNLIEYIRQGASVSPAQQETLHPLFSVDPVGAIQKEMILLQSMRSTRIDPYYVYRIGVLGKLVVQATAPMVDSNRSLRDQYYADVEKAINGTDLKLARRKLVDPRAYFSMVRGKAAEQDQTISVDYQAGIGFRGIAGSSLSSHASRSVNAVADVWYTILSSRAVNVELSPSNMRDYALGSISFYLQNENMEEVELAYTLASDLGVMSTLVQKNIADLFYDAGHYERSIEEYAKVLVREPGRRDVTERISGYYIKVGEEAIGRSRLEDARDAFASALEADALHPTAQRKLLRVEARLLARDERLVEQRLAIEEAHNFETSADAASLRRDYARAISLLGEAEKRYATVTDEFPAESREAAIGRRNVTLLKREMNQDLITNAQTLSGSGFRHDARRLVKQSPDRSEQALQNMLTAEYRSALRELERQVTSQ